MKLKLERPLALLGGDTLDVEITSRTSTTTTRDAEDHTHDALTFVFVGANGQRSTEGHVVDDGRPEAEVISEKIAKWLGVGVTVVA